VFRSNEVRESFIRGNPVGVRVHAYSTLGADPPPVADKKNLAKEIRLNVEAVETPFVSLGADPRQCDLIRP